MEIKLSEVDRMVDIAIRTRFSYYIFRITEPGTRRGFLSGGRLGTNEREAFLSSTFLPANGRVRKSKHLETGYRAIFYLAGSGMHILITSVITELGFAATKANEDSPGDC